MDQAALSKIAILSLTTCLTYKTLFPPNISKAGDKVERSTFLNRNVLTITPFLMLWLISPLVLELIPAFLTLRPNSYYRGLCPTFRAHELLNTHFVVASSLMLIGSSIRVWCYRTLGKYFTFEVTIRPHHKLITSGPYSFVRHPSYTGFFMMCIGAAWLLWNPEGALTDCGFTNSIGVRVIRALWGLSTLWFSTTVVQRTGGEDSNLKIHFGKEWEAYAARVRYALLPPVF